MPSHQPSSLAKVVCVWRVRPISYNNVLLIVIRTSTSFNVALDNDKAAEAEKREMISRFSGASSISSAQYYGRDEEPGTP